MRRTKVVCTLGPASSSEAIIRKLILAGMDVARLNFSHGTHETHAASYRIVRAIADEVGRNVAIMADLQGPKIRTGRLKDGVPVNLEPGEPLCITTRDMAGDAACVSTTYAEFPHDVKVGDRILLSDGLLELRVESVTPPDVMCRVIRGGKLGEHKGINLPGVAVSAPSLTEKDIEDLEFASALGVDYVALSFVRKPEDIVALRERLGNGHDAPRIVAKIERPEAVACFDEILNVTDAVMVARGDLGIEADLDDIPQIQKALIRKCNEHGAPVITATQMLESMVEHAQPTRAEVSDVANAIYDGTDAVMLSAETAAGLWPVEAASMMADIARKADEAMSGAEAAGRGGADCARPAQITFADAIGEAVRAMSRNLDAAGIVCFTQSGFTARAIARHRPKVPITAFTLTEATRRRCALYWGVDAVHAVEVEDIDEMVRAVDPLIVKHRLALRHQTVLITAGVPFAIGGRTNFLYIHEVKGI